MTYTRPAAATAVSSLSSAIAQPTAPGEPAGMPTWVSVILVPPPTGFELDADLGRGRVTGRHARLLG